MSEPDSKTSEQMTLDALTKPFTDFFAGRTMIAIIDVLLDADGIDKENRAASAAATKIYSTADRVGHALQDLRREKSEHALTRQSLAAALKERDELKAGPLGKAWAALRSELDAANAAQLRKKDP